MMMFWSYLGWSVLAAFVFAYLWFGYRVCLFPKSSAQNRSNETSSRAA
jgi:hypothetical protein